MAAKVSLKVEPGREQLETISQAVETLGLEELWKPELVFRVNLVLEELVLNIMDHGHPNSDDAYEIDITLTSRPEAVTIEISDDGVAFDPLRDAPEPNLDAPIEDRYVGHLGIHLARNMMDRMDYKRKGARNYLTLIANRSE